MADVARPPNGYALSLYDDLKRAVRDLPLEIEREYDLIVSRQRSLASLERQLADAESTLAWMLEYQAEEIEELERVRAEHRAALQEARERRRG